jgi:hypothetical protein
MAEATTDRSSTPLNRENIRLAIEPVIFLERTRILIVVSRELWLSSWREEIDAGQ